MWEIYDRTSKSTTMEARLDNGNIVLYDECRTEQNYKHKPDPYYDTLEFLGCGVIYSIGGVRQVGIERHAFYKKR